MIATDMLQGHIDELEKALISLSPEVRQHLVECLVCLRVLCGQFNELEKAVQDLHPLDD